MKMDEVCFVNGVCLSVYIVRRGIGLYEMLFIGLVMGVFVSCLCVMYGVKCLKW